MPYGMYTTKQAAEIANVTEATIRNYVKKGLLHPYISEANRKFMFKESDIMALFGVKKESYRDDKFLDWIVIAIAEVQTQYNNCVRFDRKKNLNARRLTLLEVRNKYMEATNGRRQ